MYMDFISEDEIVKWVYKNNGILFTRNISNMSLENIKKQKENTLVCLTGYVNVLKEFFSTVIEQFECPIVLITLETDVVDFKKEYLEHEKLKHWFTWNKTVNHEKVTCIPIGINYSRHFKALDGYLKRKVQKKENLLVVNFSPQTNNVRGPLYKKAQEEWSSFCNIVKPYPPKNVYMKKSIVDNLIRVIETDENYYSLIDNFKFVLSPPGAGLDCHRTWEALYLDCIPIVISNEINELYEELPIVVVKSWDEISKEFLEKKYDEINKKKQNNEYNMDKLYLKYWLQKIENKLLV